MRDVTTQKFNEILLRRYKNVLCWDSSDNESQILSLHLEEEGSYVHISTTLLSISRKSEVIVKKPKLIKL
jgi:hypothetical protein